MLTLHTIIDFATPSDLVELGELSRTHIEHGLGWKYTPARLRVLMRDATKNVVVARRGASVAGFGIMTYGETTANLDLLAVKTQCRHRGVGRQIVQWLEDVARTAGIASVYVQVRKTNPGAIRFYATMEYQVIEEQAGYYKGKEAAAIMCKSIGSTVDRV